MAAKRYYAYIEIDSGKQIPVFPKSRKRASFLSITEATKKLERVTRHWQSDSRGLVISTDTQEVVWTIAL